MKEDEKELALVILDASGKGVPPGFLGELWWMDRGYPDKRFYSLLAKWARKGWWEYGVSLRGGWLTDVGRAALAAATSPT